VIRSIVGAIAAINPNAEALVVVQDPSCRTGNGECRVRNVGVEDRPRRGDGQPPSRHVGHVEQCATLPVLTLPLDRDEVDRQAASRVAADEFVQRSCAVRQWAVLDDHDLRQPDPGLCLQPHEVVEQAVDVGWHERVRDEADDQIEGLGGLRRWRDGHQHG
jgi:hypothetical protein